MTDQLALHRSLPAGFTPEGALASLADANVTQLTAPASLDPDRLRTLLIERMKAGAWTDTYIGSEAITLDRAVAEIEQNSDLGQRLLSIHRRALEMLFEDEKGRM